VSEELGVKIKEYTDGSDHFKEIFGFADRLYEVTLEELAFKAAFSWEQKRVYLKNIGNRNTLMAFMAAEQTEYMRSKRLGLIRYYTYTVHEIFYTFVPDAKIFLIYDLEKNEAEYSNTQNRHATDDREGRTESLWSRTLLIDPSPNQLADLAALQVAEHIAQKHSEAI